MELYDTSGANFEAKTHPTVAAMTQRIEIGEPEASDLQLSDNLFFYRNPLLPG
jgi:hypothetical protein